MGWYQDNIWNEFFRYAYPISFVGAIFSAVLATLHTDLANVIINKNLLIVVNIKIGFCGLVALAHWYTIDLTMLDDIFSYIDLKISGVLDSVKSEP
jgi:hypothetical protein